MSVKDETSLVSDTLGALRVPLQIRKHDFGRVALAGAFEPTPRDFDRRNVTNYGLSNLWAAPIAWVQGESGRYYSVARGVQGALTMGVMVTSAEIGSSGQDVVASSDSFAGLVYEQAEDDRWTVSSGDAEAESPGFRLEFDSQINATWIETSIMDLRCTRLGPSIELYYPASLAPWYWNLNMFRVEGTILGEAVRGFSDIEFGWGHGFFHWLEHPLQDVDYWLFFMIDGAEGTEYGTLGLEKGSGFGVVVSDHGASGIYGVEYEGENGADGIPDRVRWRHAEREWTLDLATRSIASPQMTGFCWQLGQVTSGELTGIGFAETRSAFHGHWKTIVGP